MVALRILCCSIAFLLAATPAFAQTGARASEIQIKAAFIYKFGAFVEWPAEAFSGKDEPFLIGVIGAELIADELERLVAGRTIQGRSVAVKRLRRGDALGKVHTLFVGEMDSAGLADVVAEAQGQPVLIVTESENAISRGSMINFIAADNKVRFDVALPTAEREKLKISSRLLTVARRVVARPS